MVFVVSNDDLSALRMVSVAQGQSTGLWLQGLGVRNPSLTPMFKTQDSRFFPTKPFLRLFVLKIYPEKTFVCIPDAEKRF